MPMNSMRKNVCFLEKEGKVRWFLTVFLKRKRELVDKPGSVVDNHSSGHIIADVLEQPTRILGGQPNWIPIWSCYTWSLPCHKLLPVMR